MSNPLVKRIVVMGVSGSGKTAVAARLASQLNYSFIEGDDHHPRSNIAKMSSGTPLDDEDRRPWLERLNQLITESQNPIVLACSALKESYRQILSEGAPNLTWIYLSADQSLILNRVAARQEHFMPTGLVASQFRDLEEPAYGLKLDANKPIDQLLPKIIEHIETKESKKVIGLIGLGVMGRSLALNLLRNQQSLAVYNRAEEQELIKDFELRSQGKPVDIHLDLASFVKGLETPRKILMMVSAGRAADLVVDELLSHLAPEDIILDCGNSHYRDTEARQAKCQSSNVHFLGVGVSGGEQGALWGPSIMVGGNQSAYQQIAAALNLIAAKSSEGASCANYIGKGGAGHFVKMIHNGIEYAEMQLIAEIYGLLQPEYSLPQIAEIFSSWNASDSESYLLGISAAILRHKTNDEFTLQNILDRAGNKGTGSWSSQLSMQLGVPSSMMTSAVYARYTSSQKSRRVKLEAQLGPKQAPNRAIDLDQLHRAYDAARWINHAQGFELIYTMSEESGYEINLSVLASTWTNGCIIRSRLMQRCQSIFKDHSTLLDHAGTLQHIEAAQDDLKDLCKMGIDLNRPIPAHISGLSYWQQITQAESTADMIQAQRDFFGAHRYQRRDDPTTSYHTEWE